MPNTFWQTNSELYILTLSDKVNLSFCGTLKTIFFFTVQYWVCGKYSPGSAIRAFPGVKAMKRVRKRYQAQHDFFADRKGGAVAVARACATAEAQPRNSRLIE